MHSLFEALMMISFGAAWPTAIYRSWKSRQTGGKSLAFLYIVLFGYLCGIINRVINGANYVIAIYLLNMIMVGIDLGLYYRNRALELRAG